MSPRRYTPRFVLLPALLALAAGCGEGQAVQRVQINLAAPDAIDPATVASVAIAVVHDPDVACLAQPGSNSCAGLQGVDAAALAGGYVTQVAITPESGSSITVEGLPRGRTCFVAEARTGVKAVVALGCAEVELTLDRHLIEIQLLDASQP